MDRRSVALRWTILPIVLLGLLTRLAAARALPVHFDEGAMLLGVHAVAGHGLPILPSGVLYVHGATLSYLLAPLVWLGLGGPEDLFLLRAVNAVFGAITVYLTYRLAQSVVRTPAPSLLAAGFVAIDPLSVVWGGWLRSYILEQALAVAVAWLFVRQVVPKVGTTAPEGQRRELACLVGAFWLAVFAHLGSALLLPGMVAAAAFLQGRALLGSRRAITTALGLCALAPVAFVAISTWGGAAGASTENSSPLPIGTFLGDHLVKSSSMPQLDPAAWIALFRAGALGGIVPWLVFLLSGLLGLLVCRAFLTTRGGWVPHAQRRPFAAVLLLYWVPVLTFMIVSTTPRARYLLFLQPIGYVLVAAAVALPWIRPGRRITTEWKTSLLIASAVSLALLLVIHLGDGLRQLSDLAGSEGATVNRVEALEYVETHRGPTDVIFVSWPPDAYFILGNQSKIRALGPLPTGRANRGEQIDFWAGWPVTNIGADPCALITDHPGAWFVLEPLGSSLVLRDLAVVTENLVFPPSGDPGRDPVAGGTLVLRTPPDRFLQRKMIKACRHYLRLVEGG
jgi:hypothetical protein